MTARRDDRGIIGALADLQEAGRRASTPRVPETPLLEGYRVVGHWCEGGTEPRMRMYPSGVCSVCGSSVAIHLVEKIAPETKPSNLGGSGDALLATVRETLELAAHPAYGARWGHARDHIREYAPEWLESLCALVERTAQERDHERENSRAILRKYDEALADADRAEAAGQRLRESFQKFRDQMCDARCGEEGHTESCEAATAVLSGPYGRSAMEDDIARTRAGNAVVAKILDGAAPDATEPR